MVIKTNSVSAAAYLTYTTENPERQLCSIVYKMLNSSKREDLIFQVTQAIFDRV